MDNIDKMPNHIEKHIIVINRKNKRIHCTDASENKFEITEISPIETQFDDRYLAGRKFSSWLKQKGYNFSSNILHGWEMGNIFNAKLDKLKQDTKYFIEVVSIGEFAKVLKEIKNGEPIESPITNRTLNGQKHGDWIYYLSDGKTIESSGEYKNGLKNGLWYYRTEDGKHTVNYLNGKKHGLSRYYNSGGAPIKEIDYKMGEVVVKSQTQKHLEQNKKFKSKLAEAEAIVAAANGSDKSKKQNLSFRQKVKKAKQLIREIKEGFWTYTYICSILYVVLFVLE